MFFYRLLGRSYYTEDLDNLIARKRLMLEAAELAAHSQGDDGAAALLSSGYMSPVV